MLKFAGYFALIALFLPISLNAQTRTNKIVTGLDATFVDYKGVISGKIYNPKNFNPGLRLTANVYLNGLLSYSFTSSFVPKVSYPQPNGEFLPQLWMDFNTGLKIKSNTGWLLKEEARLAPYLYTGIGYNTSESINNFYLPAALGMRLRLSDMISLNLETMYRQRFSERPQPMSHSLGIVFVLPTAKQPKEDVPLAKNKKPAIEEPAKEPVISSKNRNKPQTQDPIEDPSEEKVVVTPKPNTHPKPVTPSPRPAADPNDKDGDGIANELDGCPDQAGSLEDGGCPQWAVVDKANKEPITSLPDADGDGIADMYDGCPKEAGTKQDGGCPPRYAVAKALDKSIARVRGESPKETSPAVVTRSEAVATVAAPDMDRLSQIARLLKYKTGTDKLAPECLPLVAEIRMIMDKYPDFKLNVSGFHGSESDDEDNKILAVTRAFQIKRLLILNHDKSPASIDSDGVVNSKSTTGKDRIELTLVRK